MPLPLFQHQFQRRAVMMIVALAALAGTARAADPTIDPDVLVFAQKIQAGFDNHDATPLINAVDMGRIARIVTAGIPAPKEFREGTIKGMIESDGITSMGNVILQGRYQFRFAHVVNGQTRLLFRFIGPSGLNYHDLVVERKPDDTLGISDFYIFVTGELFSQTLRVPYALAVAEQVKNATFLRQVLGADNSVVNAIGSLQDISTAAKAGNYKQALDEIDALPPAVQKLKMILMIRFQCSEQYYGASSPQSAAVVDAIRAALPDDPSVGFIALDSDLVRKHYDLADKELQEVNTFAGGHDGYVDFLRSNVQKEAGNTAAAIQFADQAIADEPTLADGYYARLGLALDAHDFATTATLLTTLRDQLHMGFKDLHTLPQFADFVKSPEYEKWREQAPAADGRGATTGP